MSAEFRLDRMGRMVTGPPDLMREWNRMRANIDRLEKAVKARTLRPTPDTQIAIGADGTRIRIRGKGGRGGGGGNLVVTTRYDAVGEVWKYRVTPGYLTYQLIGQSGAGDGPVHYYVPTLGGTSIETTSPVPEATVPAVAFFVYLRVQTTDKGVPTGTPTITHATSAQASTHHIPPSPSGGSGTGGDYYFLLAEYESNGGTPAAPRIVRRIPGNRHLDNNLVELRNVGGEREIYKGYLDGADDRHEFRTLESVGTGKAILKPEPGGGDGDTLPIRSLAIQSPLNGVMSWEGTDTADEVELKSTGASTSFIGINGGQVDFVAGIATSVTAESPGAQFAIEFTSSGSPLAIFYWFNGLAFLAEPDGFTGATYSFEIGQAALRDVGNQ